MVGKIFRNYFLILIVILMLILSGVLIYYSDINTRNDVELFESDYIEYNRENIQDYIEYNGEDIVFSIILPDEMSEAATLEIPTSHQNLNVLYNGESIYKYGNVKPIFGISLGHKNNIIRLSEELEGEKLDIEITSFYGVEKNRLLAIRMGSFDSIIKGIVEKNFFSFITSLFIILFVAIGKVISIIYRTENKDDLYPNIFMISVALWIFSENDITDLIFNNGYFLHICSYIFMHLMIVSFLYIYSSLCKKHSPKIYRLIKWISLIVITFNMTMFFMDIYDFKETSLAIHICGLMISTFVIRCIARECIMRKKSIKEVGLEFIPFGISCFLEIFLYYTRDGYDVGSISSVSILMVSIILIWKLSQKSIDEIKNTTKAKMEKYYLYRDILTNCKNRYSYETYINNINNETVNLAILDINNLKKVNDSLGHSEGDLMIQLFTDAIKKHTDSDEIFRIGGDEFVIFYDDDEFKNIEKIISDVRNTCDEVTKKLEFDLSFALGIGSENGISTIDQYNELFKAVDRKMYENEEIVKNREMIKSR